MALEHTREVREKGHAMARLLVKIATADGELAESERDFIQRCAHAEGDAVSVAELDGLARELRDVLLEDVVAPFVDTPHAVRAALLHLCVQTALADREVMPEERAILEAVRLALALHGSVLDWIVDEAKG